MQQNKVHSQIFEVPVQMKLSDIKTALRYLKQIEFVLPNGESVPEHFHVTEIGLLSKRFVDCGGTLREEKLIGFQLYISTDYDHRLGAEKLSAIIEQSEKLLQLPDAEIEVEYQGRTIEKYALSFVNGRFQLRSKQTDCLAKDHCGIPVAEGTTSCTPGSGCC